MTFLAYPNPTMYEVNVQSSEQINEVQLYNLQGQIVRTLKPNSLNFKIDMLDLPHGIYLLKVTSQIKKEKFIKIVKN